MTRVGPQRQRGKKWTKRDDSETVITFVFLLLNKIHISIKHLDFDVPNYYK